MVTPVYLRNGADLKRLALSFDRLWDEAEAHGARLKPVKPGRREAWKDDPALSAARHTRTSNRSGDQVMIGVTENAAAP